MSAVHSYVCEDHVLDKMYRNPPALSRPHMLRKQLPPVEREPVPTTSTAAS